MKKSFRYSVGPWNIHTGADVFGPPVRRDMPFGEKLPLLKKLGFDALQLHDDDAVPNLNGLSAKEVTDKAKRLKAELSDAGLEAEFVAPRLWEDPLTRDGGYTANRADQRQYALDRTKKALEIAETLGTRNIVLWLAREGCFVPESKDAARAVEQLVEAVDLILSQGADFRVMIEPKPNEPVDVSFVPTVGHALALGHLTQDPARVGVLIESAHSLLAGLDPAADMAFAIAHKKLWGVHLNDQNGMKFDQDRAFGAVNLRSAFNQVRVLLQHGFGSKGEYVGVDVKALRTQDDAVAHKHLSHSIAVVEWLADKVRSVDQAYIDARREDLDYEELDRYIIQHLLGVSG